MKTSLIPPIPNLNLAKTDEIHLVLNHLVVNPTYLSFYQDMRQLGHFIILDNSAHEFGEGQSVISLLQTAKALRAQEIVCPDALFDSERTQYRARELVKLITGDLSDLFNEVNPRIMFVPQGRNVRELQQCWYGLRDIIHSLLKQRPELKNSITWGISKDYEAYPGELFRQVETAIWMIESEFPAQIHMLGWGRKLKALKSIYQNYGEYIRSVDSAKPIVFGTQGIDLSKSLDVTYPKRPEGYFTTPLPNYWMPVIQLNIQIFREQVGDVRSL